jgi:hypothetical protein
MWVWVWLSSQYQKGRKEVIAMGQGLSPALYSRKHLTRILRGLEGKKLLTIAQVPGNQHQELVVVIDAARCLDMGVQAAGQECLGEGGKVVYPPDLRFARTMASRRSKPGNEGPQKVSGVCQDMGVQAAPQLSLSLKKKDLKALVEKGQTELMRELMGMDGAEIMELAMQVFSIVERPRSRKPSEWAKVYAGIRFIQGGHSQVRKNERAWIEGVAKRAHYDMERLWTEGSSGSGGRSRCPEKYGGSLTSSSGRP